MEFIIHRVARIVTKKDNIGETFWVTKTFYDKNGEELCRVVYFTNGTHEEETEE